MQFFIFVSPLTFAWLFNAAANIQAMTCLTSRIGDAR